MNLQTPNITQVQLLAVAGWVVAQAVAYGVLPAAYEQLAVSIGATVVAAAWKIADAVIRHGRATGLQGAKTKAEA